MSGLPSYPLFDGSQVCAQTDPELFAPESQSIRKAKGLCATCPFSAACRDWALWHGVEGVWGGTTGGWRLKERRRRGIKLAGQRTPGSLRDQVASADRSIPSPRLAEMLGCSEKSVQRYRKAA